jgi:hypothetical protein
MISHAVRIYGSVGNSVKVSGIISIVACRMSSLGALLPYGWVEVVFEFTYYVLFGAFICGVSRTQVQAEAGTRSVPLRTGI